MVAHYGINGTKLCVITWWRLRKLEKVNVQILVAGIWVQAMGLESVGVECCKKRARVARGLAAEGSGKDMQLVRPGPPEDIAEEVEARRRRYIDHRKANVAQQKERARLEKQRRRAQHISKYR